MLWVLSVACAPVVSAPVAWPEDGCEAEGVEVDSHGTKRRRARLVVSDGTELFIEGHWPRGVDCSAGVVLVPGGFQPGTDELEGDQPEDLAASGVAALTFDPRGRGSSGGAEDANGYLGQDDLAEVLRWFAARDDIDPSRVVVRSRSFGGALAAGALTRHDDLAVHGWVDVESPGWLREDLEHAPDTNRERMEQAAAEADDVEAWWDEREPAGLIAGLSVPYHRVQGKPDHALSYLSHAVAMIEAAIPTASVTLNGESLEGPLAYAGVEERAIEGGVDAGGDEVTELVLSLFD